MSARILVIETDANIKGVINTKLNMYDIAEARTGHAGVSKALSMNGTLVLIVSELHIPRMAWNEVVEALRKESNFTPIIFIDPNNELTEDDVSNYEFVDKVTELGSTEFLEVVEQYLVAGERVNKFQTSMHRLDTCINLLSDVKL